MDLFIRFKSNYRIKKDRYGHYILEDKRLFGLYYKWLYDSCGSDRSAYERCKSYYEKAKGKYVEYLK